VRHDVIRPLREKDQDDIGPSTSWIGRTIYRDLKYIRLRPILNNGDRVGMAHSMESRLPYLDHRLVEYVLTLPSAFSVGFGERKRLLRRAAARYLPDSMLNRRDKMGFMTPEPVWLRNELASDVRSAIDQLRSVPYIDANRAHEFMNRFRAGAHNDFRAIWRLYAFPAWLERFGLR
jgi:asparagine synthase (glutamine-hydrolysing)